MDTSNSERDLTKKHLVNDFKQRQKLQNMKQKEWGAIATIMNTPKGVYMPDCLANGTEGSDGESLPT